MCTRPILLKNPYYRLGSKGLNRIHDTINAYIRVPCGCCQQCVSMKQSFFNQRVQMESLRSHLYMFTLTYNNESLPYVQYKDELIAYPEYSDIQRMFKRIRKLNSFGNSFLYAVVSEYGKKGHRPHYHGILAIPKSDKRSPSRIEYDLKITLLNEWKRQNDNGIWQRLLTPISRYGSSTWDLHYIENSAGHENDVSFYVSKYLMKYQPWFITLYNEIKNDSYLSIEETNALLHKIKPRLYVSKSFGSWKDPIIRNYILGCLSRSRNLLELPQFVDIFTGKKFLLSRYYRQHLMTIDDRLALQQYVRNQYGIESFMPDLDDTCDILYAAEHRIQTDYTEKLKKILENKY